MADRKTVPILSLDSLIDRPVVIKDGVEYKLITNALLPPLDAYRVQRMSARIDELLKKPDSGVLLTEEEEAEADALPDKIVRIILEAPDELHQKLNNRERMEIIATFVSAPWLIRDSQTARTPAIPTSPSTGETSSLDSLHVSAVAQ